MRGIRSTRKHLALTRVRYINQFQAGDHIAPYWLRSALDCPDVRVPLGVSLPNANLQEHYVLVKYIMRRVDVSVLLLGLVFDDLREDGLRDEFSRC